MKSFKFLIHGTEFNVDVTGIEDNVATIEVNGTKYDVQIEQKLKQSKTPKLLRPVVSGAPKPVIDKKEKGSSSPVTAPLPGNIISIAVKAGDIIKKGQLLLVMEAMKMENQVLAEKEGVVESIKVEPGQGVLQGDVLLELI
ncbi:MAG: biotin/lipoyl-binding protein [Bacteroidales bacterium]|nr:biotin/lipoyl-binding protein [Bacteroidales bacterium]MCF8390957.1 biotin/lipoyl-binding protein [Bacteroidales bacterium]